MFPLAQFDLEWAQRRVALPDQFAFQRVALEAAESPAGGPAQDL
ncbi:MAG: hypothetical protein ACYDCG_15440 [Candidatus Acidiferrales bacterium]